MRRSRLRAAATRLGPALAWLAIAGHPVPSHANLLGSEEPKLVPQFETFVGLAASPIMELSKKEAWRRHVPGIEWVEIPSSAGASPQKALFYDSGSGRSKPLLVVLHSWSADYEQHYSVPYGMWASRNDWAFIHPDFRGPFDDPAATGSRLAVQDVLDAVEFARARARIDPERVYLSGFSGGGMMALLLAGLHPEMWTAVAAWVPVFDLPTWYGEVRRRYPDYARDIRRSCGGPPVGSTAAAKACRQRSPSTYLAGARGVPIYLATGIGDPFVSPAQVIRAFNILAGPADRLSAEDIRAIAHSKKVPAALAVHEPEPLYERAGRPLLIVKTSGDVELRVFKGRHDVIYNAGLTWLGRQRRRPGR